MAIFITSDTHFNHGNIIKYANRPFADVNEMDDTIIANWNAVVSDSDHVLHLGDFALGVGTCERITQLLNGRVYLVKGNHDYSAKRIGAYFANILNRFEWRDIVFSHKPVKEDYWSKNPNIKLNYHGHVHERSLDDDRYINCSVETTGYKPFVFRQDNCDSLLKIIIR